MSDSTPKDPQALSERLREAVDSIQLSRWPEDQERIVGSVVDAIMGSGLIEEIRSATLREAELVAIEALTAWWLTDTLPEDDTSSVQDVARAIRGLR